MKSTKPKSKHAKPKPTPITIIMPPRDYQPSKAEHEEEVDMPGVRATKIKEVFLRPVKVKVKAVKKGTSPKK